MYRPHYPAEAIMQYSPAGGPVSPAADRRLLVSYDNYTAAQRAVDTLSDAGFPVENTAIVGSDLRLEETVTGRLTNGKAALSGLITGAVFGLIVGLFLGLFTSATTSFFGLVLWSILWGAIAGAAFGFTSHAFTGGTRDFSSRSSIVAGRYDVLVASPMLDQAQALLQGGVQPADTVVVQRPPSAGPVTTAPAAAGDTAPQATGYPLTEDRAEARAGEARAEEARAEEARADEVRAEEARDDDRAGLSRGRRP
ncbi:YrzE family protein [Microbispora catharanthi]|uniref:YrzE family protein n=1 Tax=Microbispora catharanthi TaxID=1712871 RepID=UPI00197C104A|nr:YrzE family protein [Microbispora catharanthi]